MLFAAYPTVPYVEGGLPYLCYQIVTA